jgi:hypothetical protein
MKTDEINELLTNACKDFIDDCPHCGAKVHMVMIANEYHLARNGDQLNYVLFRCKPCKRINLQIYKSEQNPYSGEQNLDTKGWVAKFPSTKTEADDKFTEFVPKEVISDYEEGLRCLSSNSPKAAVSMFRRSLQDSLLNLGADENLDLIAQIKAVSKLTDDIKDWAHNIRIFGNWGAHPQKDLLKDADMEKAQEVREFIEEFFNYVYVMPGKVAAARKSYEKPVEAVEKDES